MDGEFYGGPPQRDRYFYVDPPPRNAVLDEVVAMLGECARRCRVTARDNGSQWRARKGAYLKAAAKVRAMRTT